MTEFTKTKMHFTLALLGTLFALNTFLRTYEDESFQYLDFEIKVFHVFILLAALLAFTVYCYALSLMSERPSGWAERAGNYAYGLAAMVLPIYGLLYLGSLVADNLQGTEWAWVGWVAPLVVVGIIWILLAWLLRRRLAQQDRTAKLEQYTDQEIKALNRAPELFAANHYDLSVMESWKGVEARLRRALLLHGVANPGDDPETLIGAASRAGLIHEPTNRLLHDLLLQWKIAVGTRPLTKEGAESAIKAARDILSTIPVEDPRKTKGKSR